MGVSLGENIGFAFDFTFNILAIFGCVATGFLAMSRKIAMFLGSLWGIGLLVWESKLESLADLELGYWVPLVTGLYALVSFLIKSILIYSKPIENPFILMMDAFALKYLLQMAVLMMGFYLATPLVGESGQFAWKNIIVIAAILVIASINPVWADEMSLKKKWNAWAFSSVGGGGFYFVTSLLTQSLYNSGTLPLPDYNWTTYLAMVCGLFFAAIVSFIMVLDKDLPNSIPSLSAPSSTPGQNETTEL